MSVTYDWIGYSGLSNNNQEYARALTTDQKIKKYSDKGMVNSAVYNPKTKVIHVTTDGTDKITSEHWNNWPRVMDHGRYRELKVLSAAGKIDQDKANYGFIFPEFQDQANRFYEEYKTHGAAVITSTEFPQISVTQVSQSLLNRQQLVAQKYNLLNFPEKITVPDSINIVYPEYNNTTQTVRVGYKENEPIDTSGYGTFTQTNVTLKKAGAGMAFTEEFYMRQTTVDVQSLLLDKIALDFSAARYNRIVTRLAALPNLASTQVGANWSTYAAANIQSTNRPYNDLTAAKAAITASDRLAYPDTIITNEQKFIDFYTNTWVKGVFVSDNVSTATNTNQIINNPPGIAWCKQWIINEDTPAGEAFVLDSRAIVDIEGPRKTQKIDTYNPDQTIFIQKEWFDIVTPSQRSNWGRELTGV